MIDQGNRFVNRFRFQFVIVICIGACVTHLRSSFTACSEWSNCNGHGICDTATSKCICYEGWGSVSDTTLYRSPDCSERTCPSDISWASLPTNPISAHPIAECSNAGVCDRGTGLCRCSIGYWGNACQKRSCPNDCSGHGRCLSLKQMSRQSDALPLAPNDFFYSSQGVSRFRC